ncbi:MAG: GNAT family N-acetyltransferase, partial [Anaerolineales bacterium]
PLSSYQEGQWFENVMQKPTEEHPLVIEVQQEDAWFPIGDIALMNIDWRNRSAELGISIGEKSFWNKGCGSDAIKLFLKHCFDTLNLERIFLRVHQTNQRAIRAYQKCGFIQEGLLRRAEYKNGTYLNVLIMAILKSEWDALQSHST